MEKEEIKKHFDFLASLIAEKKYSVSEKDWSPYPWMGQVENARLAFQNIRTGKGWADGHRQFFEKLAAAGFDPRKIAIIGTGKDATLIFDAFIFPHVDKVYVFELSEEKIAGAKETLKKLGADLGRIEFVRGNAATELRRFSDFFHLVDNQLLLEHLSTRPAPPWLSEEARKNYCTLPEMMEAMAQALKPNGFLTAADLIIGSQWGFEPAPGSISGERIAGMVEQTNALIPEFIKLGWSNRGANAWKSREEIAGAVLGNSRNSLKFLEQLSHSIDTDPNDQDSQARLHTIVGYVMASVVLGVDATLAATRQALALRPGNQLLQTAVGNLEKGAAFLWENAPPHIRMLGEMEIHLRKITMYYLAFKKS
jgi:hypothetical protein